MIGTSFCIQSRIGRIVHGEGRVRSLRVDARRSADVRHDVVRHPSSARTFADGWLSRYVGRYVVAPAVRVRNVASAFPEPSSAATSGRSAHHVSRGAVSLYSIALKSCCSFSTLTSMS